MALEIFCDRCLEPLKEQGALAFGPPHAAQSIKCHLCVNCWFDFCMWADPDQYEREIP